MNSELAVSLPTHQTEVGYRLPLQKKAHEKTLWLSSLLTNIRFDDTLLRWLIFVCGWEQTARVRPRSRLVLAVLAFSFWGLGLIFAFFLLNTA